MKMLTQQRNLLNLKAVRFLLLVLRYIPYIGGNLIKK